MIRPLNLDSRTVADFQASNGSPDPRIFHHLIGNLPIGGTDQKIEPYFHSALSEFIVDVEDQKFNGIDPRNGDRPKFIGEWRNFALGDQSNVTLKDPAKSNLARKVENSDNIPEISGVPIDEAVERTGHWLADTYTDRGRARPEKSFIQRDDLIFEDRIGLRDENGPLRMFNLGRPNEFDRYQAAVGLLASEANQAEIVYPLESGDNNFRWGYTETVDRDEAQNILGDDIDALLDDTAESMNNAFERVAELLEEETGLERQDIDPRDYIQMLHRSDLGSVQIDPGIIQESIEKAAKEGAAGNASKINEKSAKMVSNQTGIIRPQTVGPVKFMDAVSSSENLNDVDIESNVRKAVLGVERTEDELGLRKYRSGSTEAYSVTTIIDPFPDDYDEWDREKRLEFPFHREIDTGGGLFHWKNIYDGEDERYDSDIIRDYASLRGTLAHERVFENYVDDPDEVKGNTEEHWDKLRDISAIGDDLGPLQDIIDWKGEEGIRVLWYDQNPRGLARNGEELADKERDWIERQFENLEEELGLDEGNVIAAEEEFVHTADYPWNEDEEFSYGGTVDLLYEHESGETWLLDLKTGSMKPNYAIQQAAYKHAVEDSDFFDVDEIDRVVIPSIDPETMMQGDKDPVIYTDRPHENPRFDHSKYLDASNIDLESSDYRKNRWRPGNWDHEAFYLFARAAEQMEEASKT